MCKAEEEEEEVVKREETIQLFANINGKYRIELDRIEFLTRTIDNMHASDVCIMCSYTV